MSVNVSDNRTEKLASNVLLLYGEIKKSLPQDRWDALNILFDLKKGKLVVSNKKTRQEMLTVMEDGTGRFVVFDHVNIDKNRNIHSALGKNSNSVIQQIKIAANEVCNSGGKSYESIKEAETSVDNTSARFNEMGQKHPEIYCLYQEISDSLYTSRKNLLHFSINKNGALLICDNKNPDKHKKLAIITKTEDGLFCISDRANKVKKTYTQADTVEYVKIIANEEYYRRNYPQRKMRDLAWKARNVLTAEVSLSHFFSLFNRGNKTVTPEDQDSIPKEKPDEPYL